MKFLQGLDRGFERVIKFVLTATMVALTVLTNVLVFSRYVLHMTLGGMEELPVFLLIACVWMGGALVSKEDNHVKIDFIFTVIKNEKTKQAIQLFTTALTTVVSCIFTYLAFQYVSASISHNALSPGLRFPMWYVHFFMLLGSFASSLYFLRNTVNDARRLMKT